MNKVEENDNQEIDLVYLFKKTKEFLLSICFFFIRTLKFIYRNKLIVIGLLIIGLLTGFFLDKKQTNQFKTELIVIPNFESVDLLYTEIQNFNSNLKSNTIKHKFLDNVLKVEIKAVENLNSVLQDRDNLEVFKILTENGQDLTKVLSNEQIERSYKYHMITITTNSQVNSEKIVQFLINSINDRSYYKNRSKLALENQQQAKIQIEKSIEQINKILDNLGAGGLSTAGKDFSINNYDQLSNVIDLKAHYIKELSKVNTKLIEYKSAIYPVDISYNNKILKKLYQKNVFIIPISLFGFFLFISYLNYLFRKYNRLYLNSQENND